MCRRRTTGRAKAAALTHCSVVFQSACKISRLALRSSDVYLHLPPLFHVGGLSSAHAALHSAATHIFLPRFSPSDVLAGIQAHAVTSIGQCVTTNPADSLRAFLRSLSVLSVYLLLHLPVRSVFWLAALSLAKPRHPSTQPSSPPCSPIWSMRRAPPLPPPPSPASESRSSGVALFPHRCFPPAAASSLARVSSPPTA